MDITTATESDLGPVLTLLERAGLPTDGVADHIGRMIVARDGDAINGCAGLEVYGPYALLRSVAVVDRWRGAGLGQRLTHAALALARANGLREVFLLTTTADAFFPRFGFERIDRSDVPPLVQQSVEFTSVCPASAVVMRKRLTEERA